jgi:hypothetical protein
VNQPIRRQGAVEAEVGVVPGEAAVVGGEFKRARLVQHFRSRAKTDRRDNLSPVLGGKLRRDGERRPPVSALTR